MALKGSFQLWPLPRPAAAGRARPGVTLVELMVAVAVLTVAVVGLMGAFSFIQKGIQAAKNRTMASNLAQEKIQILKQKVYYQVLVTTDPAHDPTSFAPEVLDYDTGYFPPEEITEAGVTYTRYTYVQVVKENSGQLEMLAPDTPDTGMKLITVTVTWSQGGVKRKLSMRNVMANPDTVMTNSIFNGAVRDTGGDPINGALVSITENSGWRDSTDAMGQYTINAAPGMYTMSVRAENYFPQTRSVSISANEAQTQDFSLVRMATGTVTGYAWLADHLVISQIVGSTVSSAGYDQEYVEIYNPTTYTWTVNGQIGLKFQRPADSSRHQIKIDYLNDSIVPGGFYLFANTATVTAAGGEVGADAVWADDNSVSDFPHFASQRNIIPVYEDGGGEGCGALELYSLADGASLDKVGWDRSSEGKFAPFYETNGYDQSIGLERGELYQRKAGPGGVDPSYGPGYDSNDNDTDISGYSHILYQPSGYNSPTRTAIAATPAAGALVTCDDGLSGSATAALTGDPPSAAFKLVDVATGTWTVLISSGLTGLERTGVEISSAGSSYVFASTVTFLTETMTEGLITGRVLDAYGAPISPAIVVTPGAMGAPTSASTSNGRYTLRVAPGIVDVTANPAVGGYPLYVTQSSNSIQVAAGEVHSGVDFSLYQGGKISGFITRDGINPLPGVAVAIMDSNGMARDQQVSGLDGRFVSVNISTGFYIVRPAVGSHEMSTPEYTEETLDTAGLSIFSDTFTISGAMGYITGSVASGEQPIKTGVLIVATTATLTGTPPAPPALSAATLTGTPYYLVSSLENGFYKVEVRGSTNPAYNVYAYFPTPGGSTASIAYSLRSGVGVLPGETVTGVDFSW